MSDAPTPDSAPGKAPKLTTRDRALALAASIADERAAVCRQTMDEWAASHPHEPIHATVERAAMHESELIARLIREKMSPAGRLALSREDGNE